MDVFIDSILYIDSIIHDLVFIVGLLCSFKACETVKHSFQPFIHGRAIHDETYSLFSQSERL